MRLLSLAVAVALFIPFDSLSAQQPLSIEPGARVYTGVRRTNCTDTEATVTAMTSDSIILALDEATAPFAVSLASVTSLDVRRGRKSNVGIRTDRWEAVPLDRLRVGFAPKRNGRFALGMAVSF